MSDYKKAAEEISTALVMLNASIYETNDNTAVTCDPHMFNQANSKLARNVRWLEGLDAYLSSTIDNKAHVFETTNPTLEGTLDLAAKLMEDINPDSDLTKLMRGVAYNAKLTDPSLDDNVKHVDFNYLRDRTAALISATRHMSRDHALHHAYQLARDLKNIYINVEKVQNTAYDDISTIIENKNKLSKGQIVHLLKGICGTLKTGVSNPEDSE